MLRILNLSILSTYSSRMLLVALFALLPSLSQAQELEIYKLNSIGMTPEEYKAFVSLTDMFPWSDHPDSAVIDMSKAKNVPNIYYDWHEVEGRYRKTFLNRSGIKESEKVFVYSFTKDTIYTFPVKDLKLIAYISPYEMGTTHPTQRDYVIGFLMPKINIESLGYVYFESLVAVGTQSPFETGNIRPISWKAMDSAYFPRFPHPWEKEPGFRRMKPGVAFSFSTPDYDYFVQYMLVDSMPVGLHVVVLDARVHTPVFNTYFMDGEGCSIALLDVRPGDEMYSPQWTGKVFRNKSPMIMGFLYMSFGCNSVYFLNPNEPSIYIRCDNRH